MPSNSGGLVRTGCVARVQRPQEAAEDQRNLGQKHEEAGLSPGSSEMQRELDPTGFLGLALPTMVPGHPTPSSSSSDFQPTPGQPH
ncbi:hypothetical protein MDA_GLEAN10011809 [Myotis davidii]|uniref:Uncharacterized protein n=1 Tax=Myotis davidii TaxID=225400 RepID=L5MHB4_MYODS|nr:hypothetical protein MDA_GLEAN10011809 [Myotis davidii]